MIVGLFNDAQAIESLRSSDFDTLSAFGEVLDNSIQANAKNIKIKTNIEYSGKYLDSIAFGDDGIGMDSNTLHQCLQIGWSSRFGNRKGIGRFGVGMTLGAIHECKKVEIYTKQKPNDNYLYTYYDLEKIISGEMEKIPTPTEEEILPSDYRGLMGETGTIVIWSKHDRGNQANPNAEKMVQDFIVWIGRTYRRFIWDGISIKLNGNEIPAIDPLYVRTDKTRNPNDQKAAEVESIIIEWPRKINNNDDDISYHEIKIRMSLLPEEWREYKGSGESTENKARYVPMNEGISILRNDREVFYGKIPNWPGKRFSDIDRFWGCEISFTAELDRSFQVKNIKRGAIPSSGLKKTIHEKIKATRKEFVEKIQEHWKDENIRKRKEESESETSTGHEDAENVAKKTNTTKHVIDKDKNLEEESKKLARELKEQNKVEEQAAWEIKFQSQPFTVKDDSWKGPLFMETSHLGGNSVLLYNQKHPFFEEYYHIIDEIDKDDKQFEYAKRLKCLIDLLLISYAKTTASFDKDEKINNISNMFENIETSWGQFLKSYLITYVDEIDNE